jgi:glucose/arabinose dehydrogenase
LFPATAVTPLPGVSTRSGILAADLTQWFFVMGAGDGKHTDMTAAVAVASIAWVLLAGLAHGQTTIGLEDVVQLPASAGSSPLARINVLREAPDGSGRLFVNDLEGELYVIDGGAAQTYLDLASSVSNFKSSPGLGSGFVSFALHPEFATNGLIYTVHTETVGSTPPNIEPPIVVTIVQHAILTEWKATNPASNGFAGASRELMRIASPHRFHNLGEIAFDPTAGPSDPDYGLLYIGAGDFGSVWIGAPEQLQRLDTVFGCVLRIDPLGGPFVRGGTTYHYGVPTSNPFAADGDPDTWGEIYAYGVRNMHRLSWDPATGTLFGSDIGESNFEELNVVVPGANFGWPYREGNMALDPLVNPAAVFALPPDDADFGYSYPVLLYAHDPGSNAIAGGFPVRNPWFPELHASFVFGDVATGELWQASIASLLAADDGDPGTVAPFTAIDLSHASGEDTLLGILADALGVESLSRADLRFGMDDQNTVYLTTKTDGFVRRVISLSPLNVSAVGPWGRLLLAVSLGACSIFAGRRGLWRRAA